MDIDEKGIIVGHKICESVVRIDRRMTYTAVNAILEAKNGTEEPQTDAPEKEKSKEKAEFAKKCLEEYADFVPMFLLLDETARVLRKKRMARGAVDFDFPECKIILDAKGRPVEIRPYERNAATMLIEDCMLAANETVAEDYYWQQIPFLYRSHEKPDGEKIKRFGILINNFGYSIRLQNGELHPKEMQKLLEKAAGIPGGGAARETGTPLDEAGKVHDGMHGPLWSRSKLLYALHLPDPKIPGSPDPPDHQGKSPRRSHEKEDRPL